MTAWWQSLSGRDRAALVLAAAIAVGALAWVWIWEPLQEARAEHSARIAEQQALLNWLETITPLARRLQQDTGRGRSLEGRSLLGLVDETARAAGLAGALQRIEPGGENPVRVFVQEADFQRLMSWLERLSAERPVVIEEFNADRADAPGRVNARIALAPDKLGSE